MNTDRIEREDSIEAPIERVWEALTKPESVGTWFGNGAAATIDLRVGGIMAIDHGHGTFPTLIVVVDPPHAFSYRWAAAYPGDLATEENSMLVEFTLRSVPDGTVLRVVESGFDALTIPAESLEIARFESHSEGWTDVLAKFAGYVMGTDETPLVSSS